MRLNLRFLWIEVAAGFLCVRLFRWGFIIKDVRRHPMLFSQRRRRYWSLGSLRVLPL